MVALAELNLLSISFWFKVIFVTINGTIITYTSINTTAVTCKITTTTITATTAAGSIAVETAAEWVRKHRTLKAERADVTVLLTRSGKLLLLPWARSSGEAAPVSWQSK
jgi:hypothetical protein